jgi:hypothetical protein
MAQAVQQAVAERQLALYGIPAAMPRRRGLAPPRAVRRPVCAGCREREARYGFSEEEGADPLESRPRALCFECFRTELDRRHAVPARVPRGWTGQQVALPLEERLKELSRRRRHAQMAARHALGYR